jgi:hypothetical protein
MKKFGIFVFLLTFIALALFAGGNEEKKPGSGAQSSTSAPGPVPAPAPASVPSAASAPAFTPPPNPYYAGAAGKGISLAILVPDAQGLGGNESYLPALVQCVFVCDFSKYSAISVLDRQNAEKLQGYREKQPVFKGSHS